MNAPTTTAPFLHDVVRPLAVPRELGEMLDERPLEKRLFDALPERDRRAMLQYVLDARLPEIRERRAALAVMSLRSTDPRASSTL